MEIGKIEKIRRSSLDLADIEKAEKSIDVTDKPLSKGAGRAEKETDRVAVVIPKAAQEKLDRAG